MHKVVLDVHVVHCHAQLHDDAHHKLLLQRPPLHSHRGLDEGLEILWMSARKTFDSLQLVERTKQTSCHVLQVQKWLGQRLGPRLGLKTVSI